MDQASSNTSTVSLCNANFGAGQVNEIQETA